MCFLLLPDVVATVLYKSPDHVVGVHKLVVVVYGLQLVYVRDAANGSTAYESDPLGYRVCEREDSLCQLSAEA